ncbi:MAG: Ig-like domain-containing protein [Candidatus Zixiibacteriota bacterium]|nr:MAG: Ig-like domain-containing protein [candidate division Zixibacteria bacterium]
MTREPGKTQILVLLVFLSFIFQCAKEGMPPGGPEDTTPPEVVSVSPQPGSTQVDLGSRIEITFSERMLAKITEESVFISPLPKEPFESGWRRKRLLLTPQEPLLPDRTYVISIGTDAQDLRRNRLVKSYSFAFSTGSELDYGSISGQVWARQQVGLDKELGASVWAYVLGDDRAGIDPEEEKPDYVTQTDEEGKYTLKNLSLGGYRLFAVQDVNRDLLWEWETEAIGVTTRDVELTERQISRTNVDLVLDTKDKGGPGLLNCRTLNDRLLSLEFDEELDARTSLDSTNYEILSVSTRKPLRVLSVFFGDTETRRVFLLTDRMSPREKYDLKVARVTDRAGNPVDTSSNACLFDGSEIADTTGPNLVALSPKDREEGVPLDSKIKLVFNEPPEQQTTEIAFSLVDSNKISVDGEGEWLNLTTFTFTPLSPLAGEMEYSIRLRGEMIRDSFGDASAIDSSFAASFVTLDEGILGSVSGEVGTTEMEESTTVVLTLWHPEKGELWYEIALPGPGPFVFERVLPGKYFLAGYLDLNGDRNLSLGQPEPFSPLEPFVVYADTIHVRSRWETEGLRLKFQ